MSEAYDLSIIIPVKPGEGPDVALAALRGQSHRDRCEVLVVYGTRPAQQRNMAVNEAHGRIVYFLDNDSEVSADTIRIGLEFLESNPAAVIGGPALTRLHAGWLEQCFGLTMALYAGSGFTDARHRVRGVKREVRGDELTLCNLMMSREVFQKFSGLSRDLYPSEDPEFLKRLRAGGVRLFYDPEMWIRRSRRSSLGGFLRQFFGYGAGRARHIFVSTRPADLFFFLPALFLGYLVILCLTPGGLPVWPLGFFLAVVMVEAFYKAEGRGAYFRAICAAPLTVLMLCAYGAGFIAGLLGWRKIGGDNFRIERVQL